MLNAIMLIAVAPNTVVNLQLFLDEKELWWLIAK
jgi:hypothetical protein